MKHWEKVTTFGGTYIGTKGDGLSSVLVRKVRPTLFCSLYLCQLRRQLLPLDGVLDGFCQLGVVVL